MSGHRSRPAARVGAYTHRRCSGIAIASKGGMTRFLLFAEDGFHGPLAVAQPPDFDEAAPRVSHPQPRETPMLA